MRPLATAAVTSLAVLCGSSGAQGQVEPEGVPPLFAGDEPFEVTITGPIEQLKRDRRESPDRPGHLTVTAFDGSVREVGVDIRTRGQFRLDPSNCAFPPLRLDVRGSEAVGTVFEGQDELKLVSSCRPGSGRHDDLVPLEYLAYRTYRLVTETSFRVRLISLRLVDPDEGVEEGPRTAFLIEDDEALAERLGFERFSLEEGRNLPADAFDPLLLATTSIFQYMIGNHDWSAVAGHNVEILARGGGAIPVPYDFDFSGLVDAPYATPPPEYRLDSVRERYYRGWCVNPFATATALNAFRDAHEAILALWEGAPEPGEETRRRAIGYLEGFFDEIATDERAQRRFLRDCRTRSE